MEQSLHALSAEPVQYALLTRVYGGVGSPALKKKLENSWRDFLPSMERLFLNESGATATIERAQVAERVASLVTFSSDIENMKRWEVSADVRAISTDLQSSPAVVEANLHSLVRDFGACIAIPLLYGNDFLDRNPRLLDDLWKFDSGLFIPLLLGVPTWAPFQVIKDGLGARSRLLSAMESLYRCISEEDSSTQSLIFPTSVAFLLRGTRSMSERAGPFKNVLPETFPSFGARTPTCSPCWPGSQLSCKLLQAWLRESGRRRLPTSTSQP